MKLSLIQVGLLLLIYVIILSVAIVMSSKDEASDYTDDKILFITAE